MNLQINNINDFKQIIGNEPHYGSPILPYSQEEDFKELSKYFEGKTVAIVGPAPDLIGQNKGAEIDSYDIVCKIGQMTNINDDKDYGSKIDVLFNGCFPDYPINIKDKKVQKIICPVKPCMPGVRDVHNRDLWAHYNYLKRNLSEIKFNNIGILSCLFDNRYKTRATVGSFAVFFLLQQKLKKLGIYGMTWYKNSGYQYHSDYNFIWTKNSSSHGCDIELEKTGIKQHIKLSSFEIYLNNEVFNALYE